MIPPGALAVLALTPLFLVLAHQHERAGRMRWAWIMVGMALLYPAILCGMALWGLG